jgi:FKBP-type peptidyl-prolyl cis-trans isomerase FkpA
MKQIIFTLLLISAIGLVSCRKNKVEPDIKQYDQIQIQNYIAANGLTGMVEDKVSDSSGMYYQILNPGSGTALDYPDKITFVYTFRTLDGSFATADTITNHYYDYVGHISNRFPLGLQMAVHDLLKYPGASMHVLVPSHLAYGAAGSGSGSSQVANNRIKGNESLDYYVHAISNFHTYDDMVIKNYMNANGLTGYTKVKSTTPITVNGVLDTAANYYYYKILTSATTTDPITANSTITATYTGQIFDGNIFDATYNGTNIFSGPVNFIPGVQEGLINNAVAGTKISLLIPSLLGYGLNPPTGIPPFSCLRFTWQIITVTP